MRRRRKMYRCLFYPLLFLSIFFTQPLYYLVQLFWSHFVKTFHCYVQVFSFSTAAAAAALRLLPLYFLNTESLKWLQSYIWLHNRKNEQKREKFGLFAAAGKSLKTKLDFFSFHFRKLVFRKNFQETFCFDILFFLFFFYFMDHTFPAWLLLLGKKW